MSDDYDANTCIIITEHQSQNLDTDEEMSGNEEPSKISKKSVLTEPQPPPLLERPKKIDEKKLKREYYLSEPLKNLAQNRGESILPTKYKKHLLFGHDDVETVTTNDGESNCSVSRGKSNHKQALPKIYAELRETTDLVENRKLYKQRMRTKLNLSSSCLLEEVECLRGGQHHILPKSQIDMIENSRKTYSEFSRFNISRPLKLDNVESVLKKTIFNDKKGSQ